MRPIEFLPMPHPKDFDPSVDLDELEPDFFYNNFVKHFIPDMIQMMDTGLTIDQDAVEDLRKTVEEVLLSVIKRLEDNPLIKQFQLERLPQAQKDHAEKCTQAIREVDHYIKDFNDKDVVHRTWVVNTYLTKIHKPEDAKDKWVLKDLKKYNIFLKDPFIRALCDKRRLTTNADVCLGMLSLAKYKLELWNRPRYDKAEKPVVLDTFNPGSSKQMKGFFEMVGVEPLAYSKETGEASWGRDQLVLVQEVTSEGALQDALEAMIDFSFSSIIKSNFLNAFDKFTIDGVLHGNIRLFGAKSFRNTSDKPNLFNMPSTKSIYAKPLKKCFKAPEGYVVYAIDYSALEDRGIANLTEDTNKCNIFLEGLDGHSLNACGYFPELIEAILGPNVDNVAYVRKFKAGVDDGDKELDAIRFRSKAPTFKLAYGGYPDAHKGGVITQEIFDNYHNVLYPGITDYRENYVLATAERQGYIHLGLGCRLYTNDPNGQIRTLHNATCQFWSILTLIAINELNYQAREQGMSEDVIPHSTIYDSLYIYVKKDAESIKWLNDTLVPIMNTDYLIDTIVPNECVGEIGNNWAELNSIPNNASIKDIQEVLNDL